VVLKVAVRWTHAHHKWQVTWRWKPGHAGVQKNLAAWSGTPRIQPLLYVEKVIRILLNSEFHYSIFWREVSQVKKITKLIMYLQWNLFFKYSRCLTNISGNRNMPGLLLHNNVCFALSYRYYTGQQILTSSHPPEWYLMLFIDIEPLILDLE
jgi:hypothetical protein